MRPLLGHTELYQPTVLLTLPGARQQHWHRDADHDDVYSMLIAITDRDFCFKEAGLVHLRAGDVLIFKGSMCHAGAELTRDAVEASIAVHVYGGNGVTADVLASIFTDPACH
jgi:ectoine hydroxylase-related dioxygenase (phytanoyl-CoA dioxygenase family)